MPAAKPSRPLLDRLPFCGILLIAALVGCATPEPSTSLQPVTNLKVASDLDNLPFAGVDADGSAIGRDVEMMQALAEQLGAELTWQRMPFDELLPAVEAGTVDAVCATLGITPERERSMAFTRPYFRTVIAVVVRKGPGEPTSLADLAGRRVSGGQGTTAARAVSSHLPASVAVTDNPKGSPTAERLAAHEIDGAAMDGPAAQAMVAASNGTLRLLDEALDEELYGIAMPLGREDLHRAMEGALAELEQRGVLRALNARHGLQSMGASAESR